MKGEMVSFLGRSYPLHTWDLFGAFLVMGGLLALYYIWDRGLSDG